MPEDYYPAKFSQKFASCFFWWDNLSKENRAALGGNEDNWSLRLLEMCKPEFGVFPHAYFRFSNDQAKRVSVTLKSCTDAVCIARLVVSYAQTRQERWMNLLRDVHINRFALGGRYEQLLYCTLDYFAKPISATNVVLFAEMVLEWVKQAAIFVHFFSERPRFLKYYGVSSIKEKVSL